MVVFEELKGPFKVICGTGVAVFVHDEFLHELKKRPFWIGPELAKRIMSGSSPVLSDKQFRKANSTTGLNHVTWEGIVRTDFEENSELRRKLPNALIAEHRGLFLNEAIANQMDSAERLRWTLEVGALIWNPVSARYVSKIAKDPREFVRNPPLSACHARLKLGGQAHGLVHFLSTHRRVAVLAPLSGNC
jgi:hypothetical protein